MSVSADYCSALEKKFNADPNNSHEYWFEIEGGRKFDRLVIASALKGARDLGVSTPSKSAFAFVEKETGALIKAATYKAPAKIKTGWATKYNLNTQFDLAVEVADPYGGYLYQ